MLYVAYGANTSSEHIKMFCPSARFISVVNILNYRLLCLQYLTIIKSKGSTVTGVLWNIDNEEISELDNKEIDYNRIIVPIDDETFKYAYAYVYPNEYINTIRYVKPSVYYLRLCFEGYRENNIDYRQILNSINLS